jgi:hypothetical protein
MKRRHLKKVLVSNRKPILSFFIILSFFYAGFIHSEKLSYLKGDIKQVINIKKEPEVPPLDKADYDSRMLYIANIKTPITEPSTTSISPSLWPKEELPYPNSGAILPFKRIIAYYGNLYSTKMGVLGEYEEEEMLSKLENTVSSWTKADPNTPALPALHYIAVTAQLSPGEDGKHRLRMPDSEIDKVLKMAEKIGAIVFLDIQVGFSTLQSELPRLEKYFKMPNVHLGVDAEFSMKNNIRPGKVVGTFDAVDINYAINYLSNLVKENNITPKVLVVHRYTQKMITNYQNITPTPEVQVVMHMDGWGGKAKKKNTYEQFIYKEPVQFAGFKIFYKNDKWNPNSKVINPDIPIFTPEELIELSPRPIYIQYQ